MKWRIKGDVGGMAVDLVIEELADTPEPAADTPSSAPCAPDTPLAAQGLAGLLAQGLALLQQRSPLSSGELIDALGELASSDKLLKQALMQLREHEQVHTEPDQHSHQRLYFWRSSKP